MVARGVWRGSRASGTRKVTRPHSPFSRLPGQRSDLLSAGSRVCGQCLSRCIAIRHQQGLAVAYPGKDHLLEAKASLGERAGVDSGARSRVDTERSTWGSWWRHVEA